MSNTNQRQRKRKRSKKDNEEDAEFLRSCSTITSTVHGQYIIYKKFAGNKKDGTPICTWTTLRSPPENLVAPIHVQPPALPDPIPAIVAPVPSQPQSAELLDGFLQHSDRLRDLLLEAESPTMDGENPCQPCLGGIAHPCHKCHSTNSDSIAQYRCCDCFPGPLLCKTCILESHIQNSFHRFEQWSSNSFLKVRPCDLGQILHLGHNNSPCPSLGLADLPIRSQIVDTNGFHQMAIRYCACPGAGDRVTQLMRAHLFPSSTKLPTLAFTFRVLRDFQIHTFLSNKTASDYMAALQRVTHNASSHNTPNPYNQFLRVMRIYRQLLGIQN